MYGQEQEEEEEEEEEEGESQGPAMKENLLGEVHQF